MTFEPRAGAIGAVVRTSVLLTWVVFATHQPATAQSDVPASQTAAVSFAGEWDTTYGRMTMTQDGAAIRGVYITGTTENQIEGTLKDRRLSFTYKEASAVGEGWFELSVDGSSFAGQWRERGAGAWSSWTGKRPQRADTFAGLWQTTWGLMRLHVAGDEIRGCYSFAGVSKIRGRLSERRFTFEYDQPDGEKGAGWFELAADGQTFAGEWTPTAGALAALPDAEKKKRPWSAKRVQPQPGRMWLVVLEAHWESSLTEPEYSYGHMLREFFRRTPHVQLRHRYFHDEKDLRRFCEEVRFLPEPVIVYISTHGTEAGISVGRDTIGAAVLAECLQDSGDIRLLHLGGCLMMQGDMPKQIHAGLGAQATFPISGFTNVADWAGSAVVDFTYLDLILSRNVAPAVAAEQVRKMMSFARERGEAGDTIAPAGLRVLAP